MGRGKMLEMAAVFYAVFVAIALVWAAIAGRPAILWVGDRPSIEAVGAATLAGVAFGLVIVGLSRIGLSRLAWMKNLSRFFSEVVGPLSWTDAFGLAVMSSIGEELLFRGALQPSLGLIPATLLFTAMHFPPNRSLLPWTLSAGVLGLVFGLSFEWTGNVAAPMAAHFTINLFNLKAVAEPHSVEAGPTRR